MNKLLFALIAAVIAASSFSAVAADAVAPKSGAMTPAATAAKDAAPAAAETAPPMMRMRHREARNPAQLAMREGCRKNAAEQKLKGADRKTFIRDCMSKQAAAAVANKDAAVPAAKESAVASAVKKDAAVPAAKK